jgi:hypothetical protein
MPVTPPAVTASSSIRRILSRGFFDVADSANLHTRTWSRHHCVPPLPPRTCAGDVASPSEIPHAVSWISLHCRDRRRGRDRRGQHAAEQHAGGSDQRRQPAGRRKTSRGRDENETSRGSSGTGRSAGRPPVVDCPAAVAGGHRGSCGSASGKPRRVSCSWKARPS